MSITTESLESFNNTATKDAIQELDSLMGEGIKHLDEVHYSIQRSKEYAICLKVVIEYKLLSDIQIWMQGYEATKVMVKQYFTASKERKLIFISCGGTRIPMMIAKHAKQGVIFIKIIEDMNTKTLDKKIKDKKLSIIDIWKLKAFFRKNL